MTAQRRFQHIYTTGKQRNTYMATASYKNYNLKVKNKGQQAVTAATLSQSFAKIRKKHEKNTESHVIILKNSILFIVKYIVFIIFALYAQKGHRVTINRPFPNKTNDKKR